MAETTPAEAAPADAAARTRELRTPGAPALAVREYGRHRRPRPRAGGEAPPTPVVLLHGIGGTLEEWDPVARLLAEHRPVHSVDLRGHGLSGDAPWSLDGFVDDLIRLIGHLDADRPLVAGYGLGGAAAACAAARRSDLAGAVNVDGLAWPTAEHAAGALGLGPQEAGVQVDLARAYSAEQAAAFRTPLGAEEFTAVLEGLRAMGTAGSALAASAARSAVAADGLRAPRPGPRAVRAALEAFEEFAPDRVYARLLVPVLALVSTGPAPRPPGAPARYPEVVRAAAAAELSRTAPLLRARPLERAAHGPHVARPEDVAGAITSFLEEVGA
ncbi:alpha/beta fold hydrolase [Nocardiopsis baichengensis]|uniref:alpha/beta fold hydrolase n=1 Tax=Nocardiopsis baichengensis TaxID=280240 RepID=UPI00034A9E5B|nr:alpha/beta hydrolase [Nocardiopsis baichengensis]